MQSIKNLLTHYKNSWLNLVHQQKIRLFTGTCILCRMSSECSRDLCSTCELALPWLKEVCKRCAKPQAHTGYCRSCLQAEPNFNQAHALWAYRPPIDKLIWKLKFQQHLAIAQILGELMAKKMCKFYEQTGRTPSVIVPVPIAAKRLSERGFNQAVEIARPISKQLGLPLIANACKRTRETMPQVGLSAKARADNVHHAFKAKKIFKDKHVCIIDDVMTTGNTINSVSQALKAQDAAYIEVWCIARANLLS